MDNELVVSEAQTKDSKSCESLNDFLQEGISVEDQIEIAEVYATVTCGVE